MRLALTLLYQLGAIATFVYLAWFDAAYTWWNWVIIIPVSAFLAEIWPLYWAVIVPLNAYVISPVFGDNHLLAIAAMIAFLATWLWFMGCRGARR